MTKVDKTIIGSFQQKENLKLKHCDRKQLDGMTCFALLYQTTKQINLKISKHSFFFSQASYSLQIQQPFLALRPLQ